MLTKRLQRVHTRTSAELDRTALKMKPTWGRRDDSRQTTPFPFGARRKWLQAILTECISIRISLVIRSQPAMIVVAGMIYQPWDCRLSINLIQCIYPVSLPPSLHITIRSMDRIRNSRLPALYLDWWHLRPKIEWYKSVTSMQMTFNEFTGKDQRVNSDMKQWVIFSIFVHARWLSTLAQSYCNRKSTLDTRTGTELNSFKFTAVMLKAELLAPKPNDHCRRSTVFTSIDIKDRYHLSDSDPCVHRYQSWSFCSFELLCTVDSWLPWRYGKVTP